MGFEDETIGSRTATDEKGHAVVLQGSSEAVRRFGWETLWEVGGSKYARGEYEQLGEVRLVSIAAEDCEREKH